MDHIIRAITSDGYVKAMAIRSTDMVERAKKIHDTTPTATAALGRVLTATSMMGNLQKVPDGAMTMQIKGGGPLGTILATSDSVGNVRGYVTNPQISLLEKYVGKLHVGAAVGTEGMLTVIRDLQMKEPYIGSVPLVTGEIADDVTAYFAQSEQTPTACALGVLIDTDCTVKVAGGYLIQLLPGAPDDIIMKIETGIACAGAVTPMLESGMSPEEILKMVLCEFELEFFEQTPVEYRCYCSRERVEKSLIAIGKKDLQEIVDEDKDISIECQFCDNRYIFTPKDVQNLLETL